MARQEGVLLDGALFCIAIMTFLTAHEMGHYLACRKYKIDATLPYFIPFPSLFGTMGAFIKIKSPITSRKALFDIGAAGPIAGFVIMIPWMYFGINWSSMTPAIETGSKLYLGEPLITRLIFSAAGLTIPAGYEISAHPVFIAAWFGAIATAINLIPVGQLDGGHIVYSIFTRRAENIYKLAFGITAGIALFAALFEDYPGWIVWLILVYFLMRKGHPPTMNDRGKLGPWRIAVALFSLVIFILTFMPVPIRMGDLL